MNTNPELILQLKKLILALTVLVHALGAQVAATSHFLGTATVTAGNNYPTSSYTFNDNDIINAGDLNNISSYTGIRTATDTITLQGQIYNVSSSLASVSSSLATVSSSLATVSSTIRGVAQGGTATSTFGSYGVLVASSTNPIGVVAPGTNGNVLTSNGTIWTSAASTGGATVGTTTKAIQWTLDFPTANGTAYPPSFVFATNATLTAMYGVNMQTGDTVTFNFFMCTSMAVATSTCKHVFTNYATSTSITTASQWGPGGLVAFASSSASAGDILRFDASAASSTGANWTIWYQ